MHDSIGVTLKQDSKGKFAAFRVYIDKDKVVEEQQITTQRYLTYALRAAVESLESIPKDWSRNEIDFRQPEQLTFAFFEHGAKK